MDLRLKKEKKSPTFYGFHTFAEPGCPVSLNSAFRDNICQFLQQCADLEDYKVEGMHVWCTLLVYGNKGSVLPLYTVEENVEKSENPFCDYCRCSGWTNNFVSKRKYHFIIPIDDDWDKPLAEGSFDLESHLLHGLIHCNGYGHLLCINGVEGGSKFIHGREIMDLWDRICTTLHARQISVEDLSKKHSIDLRLLHGVAYGRSWFSSWGYRFSLGSFGVKEHNYDRAIEILSSVELDQIIKAFNLAFEMELVKLITDHYRKLSETDLVTIRDLFHFMLSPKSRSPTQPNSAKLIGFSSWTSYNVSTNRNSANRIKPAGDVPLKHCPLRDIPSFTLKKIQGKGKAARCRKFSNLAANMDSRWPVRRLEQVAEVIVDALKEKRATHGVFNCGMTRQEARDAARVHIGDTGLIDHVLKSMNNVTVGNYIVRRAVNRVTKVLEYTIHDLNSKKGIDHVKVCEPVETSFTIEPGRNVWNDIELLYKNLLMEYPGGESVKLAVQTLLFSKIFVKEWPFLDEDEYSLRFICRMLNSSIDLNDEFPIWPREYVVVPLHETVGGLKLAVERALRETYFVLKDFDVTDIVEIEEVEDSEVLFGIIESGKEIRVRGYGVNIDTELRYEGGGDNWTVKCKCGARDDDGERMVSCDICEVWQHTRCIGIEDADKVPRFFVCYSCCCMLAPVQTGCGLDLDSDYPMLMGNPIEMDTGMLYCK